ncbi:phage tail tape measure protein [Blastococcus sp. CT_GayMR16]|uniref:phage tail tape measure protein n=1 Tax=Blastococcus sp. CT_GayMR16 TaxID=2559607 RepID=UPI001073937E|nr:phage tail tape measure protein [Blastococcus sp. CT_GayMR16]TFV91410.1 hypothetical protein E4P38_02140 [Blastococcus sp. CT_GayMR16]
MSLTAAELRATYTVDESELDDSIGGIPGKIKASTAALAGAGLLIGGALAGGLMQGMENEAVNDQLAAQLGLTAPESERIGGIAGQLYAEAYGDSLGGVNDAVAAVMTSIGGMRNASSSDLKAVTADAMNFAAAFNTDVAGAAATAGLLIKNGLAKDAGEAFDLMTKAAQEAGPQMVDPIREAADEYGVNFAALGFSGREAMAMLVDGAKGGEIALDKVGDAVKEFTIRSTDMSTASTDAYKAIGLDAETMANKILAGGDTAQAATQKIIDGILGIEDPAKRANTAIALFGTPIEDLGTNQIPDFLRSLQMSGGELENVAGSIDRVGETLSGNASTNIEKFKRQATQAFVDLLGGKVLPVVSSVASTLATTFGPAVKGVGDVLTGTVGPALKSTAQWISDNKTPLLIVAGVITSVFLPALIAMGVQSMISAAKSVAAWVLAQAGALTSLAVQSLVAVGVVAGWVLMGAQAMLGAARMAAAWLIAMGPVGWVIAAVVGLVALIVANWDTVVAWTKAAWDTVVGWIVGAWEWIKSAVASGVQWVLDAIGWFGQLPGRVAAWFGGVKDAALGKLGELVSWLGGLPGRILSAIGDFGSMLLNAGRELLEGLWNGIKNAGSWLLGKVGSFFGSLLPGWVKDMLGIQSPSTVFAEIGRYLMLGLGAGIDSEAQTAVDAAKRAAAAVTDAMQVDPMNLLSAADAQAMAGLTARRPLGATTTGATPGAGSAGTAGPAGTGPLVNIEEYYEQPGSSPAANASALAVEVRTRPWT